MKLTKIFIAISICIILSFYNITYAGYIEYKGEAEGLIASEEKLFLDFEDLIPGDTVINTVDIKNDTNGDVYIYFKPQNANKINELLDKLDLKITLIYGKKRVELYSGTLGSNSIKRYIYLGRYLNGFDGQLEFKIDVPLELTNINAGNHVRLDWIFAATGIFVDDDTIITVPDVITGIENEIYADIPDDKVDFDNVGTTVDSQIVDTTITNVKTGDNIIKTIKVFIIAIILFVIITIYKIRKRKEEKA